MFEIFEDSLLKIEKAIEIVIYIDTNSDLLIRCMDRADSVLSSFDQFNYDDKIQATRSLKNPSDLKIKRDLGFV